MHKNCCHQSMGGATCFKPCMLISSPPLPFLPIPFPTLLPILPSIPSPLPVPGGGVPIPPTPSPPFLSPPSSPSPGGPTP